MFLCLIHPREENIAKKLVKHMLNVSLMRVMSLHSLGCLNVVTDK